MKFLIGRASALVLLAAGLSGCGDDAAQMKLDRERATYVSPAEEAALALAKPPSEKPAVVADETAAESEDGEVAATGPRVAADKLPNLEWMPISKEIYGKFSEGEPAFEAYELAPSETKGAKINMVPIKGGTFAMGSPAGEEGHKEDEAPQHEVTVDSFWMSETEVTWDLYRAFMENGDSRNKDGTLKSVAATDSLTKIVSQPTPPYIPMHFDMGGGGYDAAYPAIAMTQHAASKFCEWLSAQTGEFYRLPTEAEWEYACRAGTTTAYSFGDDAAEMDDYAWYAGNSDFEYQPVKLKKPNPWGLYDMHGNVAEWTLDGYVADGYAADAKGAENPWRIAEARYPRVVRGGHWDQDPEDLRSAARLASDPSWKVTDPQQPKSIWYHTDVLWLGLRIVRPAKVPPLQDVHLYWNTGPGEQE